MTHSINPYDLLGVTINSSLKEIKKAYYNLALLCHPDKGGSNNDMIMIHNAYLYVKKQIEFSLNKEKLENIEDDFKNYFKKNYRKPPNFYEIWLESDEAKFLKEFNNKFDSLKKENINEDNILFNKGYGKYMEKSNINTKFDDEKYKRIICQLPLEKVSKKLIYTYLTNLKNIFRNELIIYEKPNYLPDNYGNNERFDVDEVNDFSHITEKLQMADYRIAYGGKLKIKKNWDIKKKSLEDIIKEREKFDEKINNIQKKSNIEFNKKKYKKI